jgi:mannose-6-phosphate isomerase-like protein (cupin superfamily)
MPRDEASRSRLEVTGESARGSKPGRAVRGGRGAVAVVICEVSVRTNLRLTWTKPLFGSESSGASCPRLTTRNAGDANTSSFKVHHEGRQLPFVVLEGQGECGRGGDNAVGTEITLISMRVRIRAPSGQHTVELDAEATVGDLKALIAEQAGVAIAAQELLAGFPPKKVTAGDGDTCASSGIAQGEIITVNELELAAPEPAPTPPNPDQIVIPDDDDIVASTPPEAAGPRGGATADIPLEGDEDHALMMAIAASMEEANARTTKVPRIDGDWTDMATDGDDAVMSSPHNGRERADDVRGRRDGRGQARHRQRQLVPLQRRRLRHVAVVAGGAAAPAGHRRRRRRGYVHVHRGVLG